MAVTEPVKLKVDKRGGAGRGQGRKTSTPKERINVSIDSATAERLRFYGSGNLSEGIRRAALLIPDYSSCSPVLP